MGFFYHLALNVNVVSCLVPNPIGANLSADWRVELSFLKLPTMELSALKIDMAPSPDFV